MSPMRAAQSEEKLLVWYDHSSSSGFYSSPTFSFVCTSQATCIYTERARGETEETREMKENNETIPERGQSAYLLKEDHLAVLYAPGETLLNQAFSLPPEWNGLHITWRKASYIEPGHFPFERRVGKQGGYKRSL